MSDRARSMILLTAAALLGTGCPDGGAPAGAPTASTASASAPGATSAAPEVPELPTPEPLDVAKLEQTLRCGAQSKGGPCRVLAGFKECKPHRLLTPSGDGRWMGTAYLVKGTDYTEDFALLRSRRVPLAEVGKSQLTARIGLVKLPDEETLRLHAGKVVSAASRGDVPKVNNTAVSYLKGLKEWEESYAIEAKDNQVFVVARDSYYLCSTADQRLLVVQQSSAAPGTADGQYVELWPVTW